MNGHFKKITADKVIFRALVVSSISIVITGVYTGFSYAKLPPLVPLLNQAPWGDARITPRVFILLPFVLTLVIFFLNIVVSSRIYDKVPLLSRMLSVATFLISILSFIFYFRTLQLLV